MGIPNQPRNENWQRQVRWHLADGYGAEDIALMMSCEVEDVRREVVILRESGELEGVLHG